MNKTGKNIVKKATALGLIVLTVLFFILSSIYIWRTSFTGSIQIGLGELSSDKYKVVGITPLGKEAQFSKYDYFYFDDSYRLLKEIHIKIDADIGIKQHLIIDKNNYKTLEKENPQLSIFIGSNGTKTSKHIVNFIKFLLRKSWVVFVVLMLLLSLVFSVFSRKDLVKISSKAKKLIREKPRLIASIYLGISLTIILLSGTINWSNNVISGHTPDQVDYQNMAVNQKLDYGVGVSGQICQNTDYKIIFSDKEAIKNNKIIAKRLDRFPAYSFSLGLIYKITGIQPIAIKILQFIILLLIVTTLPILGKEIWDKKGFWAGIIVIPPIFLYLSPYVEIFTADISTVLINILSLLFYIKTRKNFNYKNSLILGLLLGFGLLFKPSLLIFIILLFIDLSILAFFKQRKKVKEFLMLIIAFFVMWLPYNIYAINYAYNDKLVAQKILNEIDKKNYNIDEINKLTNAYYIGNKELKISVEDIEHFKTEIEPSFNKRNFIVLEEESTEGQLQLSFLLYATKHSHIFFLMRYHGSTGIMDINNEYVTNSHPNNSWAFDSTSFYLNDNLQDKSELFRVLNFYWNNPKKLSEISLQKLNNYFENIAPAIPLIILIMVFFNTLYLKKRNRKKTLLSILISIFILGFLIFVPSYKSLVLIFSLLHLYFSEKGKEFFNTPIIFILINLFIFPLATFGNSRYLIYYDFVLFLLSGLLIVELFSLICNYKVKLKDEIY
ncbi:MAG: MFS transporter [Bacteroidales bacterium]|nr:MFS transporter [Bacteroidales bacterium]